jgi:hypothetical protein
MDTETEDSMALRFRKRLKVLPGVHANLGKQGASLSVGGRGATLNVGKRGVRSTVGIPGTGLSYTSKPMRRNQEKRPAPEHAAEAIAPGARRTVGVWLALVILFAPYLFAWATLHAGHSNLARIVSFGWLAFMVAAFFAR